MARNSANSTMYLVGSDTHFESMDYLPSEAEQKSMSIAVKSPGNDIKLIFAPDYCDQVDALRRLQDVVGSLLEVALDERAKVVNGWYLICNGETEECVHVEDGRAWYAFNFKNTRTLPSDYDQLVDAYNSLGDNPDWIADHDEELHAKLCQWYIEDGEEGVDPESVSWVKLGELDASCG